MAHAEALYAEITDGDPYGYEGIVVLAREYEDDGIRAVCEIHNWADVMNFPRDEWINILDLPTWILAELRESRKKFTSKS